MTFDEMLELEPRLRALRDEIRRVKDDGREHLCANELWYGTSEIPFADTFKGRMCKLVGWDADVPALRTEEAYDVALDALYSELPDCRNCGCW